MAEQRYRVVLAVIGKGSTVTEVAGRWSVSRQSVHVWLARYEADGQDRPADRSHRPASCPHQMDPHRALTRAGLIEPGSRRRRAEHWRR